MKSIEKSLPFACMMVALLLMAFFGYQATEHSLTELEAYGFQAFSLVIGLTGSYFFGRRLSKGAIKEIVEPHARSAFRRLISLYRSIYRVVEIIDGEDSDGQKIAVIRAIVVEQMDTAEDALDDWRDLVPESVEELSRKLRQEVSGSAK